MVSGWVRALAFVVDTFSMLGSEDILSYEDLVRLDVVRDQFLGPAKDMTSKAPAPDPNNQGKLTGGTAFERCGQRAVKDTGRCYSLTVTHQRQRALVGLTSSGKYYDSLEGSDEHSLNLEIRGNVTQVSLVADLGLTFTIYPQINAHVAMTALKIGAPEDYVRQLEEHADIVNLPRVGVDTNIAFPAIQANIAPAIAFDDALGAF